MKYSNKKYNNGTYDQTHTVRELVLVFAMIGLLVAILIGTAVFWALVLIRGY